MPSRPRPRRARTYAAAGVDRRRTSGALAALLSQVRYRSPAASGRALLLEGHYAGLIRIGRETIAITTDTVGTKSILAEQLGRWEEIGVDAVAVNVNDLASVGARPAGLVDVISCRRADPDTFAQIGRGIDRGLRAARCALLGGETAIVPELIQGVDVGGTAIGFFPQRRKPITGARIRSGDIVLGIPSSGLHANGLTLARRVVAESRLPLGRPRPGGRRPLGEELLTASRIYVAAAEALADRPTTTGFAHISGGGVRNLPRLRHGVRFVLDGWPTPVGLFRFLAEAGGLSTEELYQTFNMGIGFVVVVRPSASRDALATLRRAGYADARVVGRVEPGEGVTLPQLGLTYRTYS
ncbi:MAG TPA: phosphoribosylformylglycinamidine cyclo-ligase [Thermoplasmata archaeon]|nr:phosphoribosylformylglycinamidine cyclo-ligase [Thermoplasmata archaeon]